MQFRDVFWPFIRKLDESVTPKLNEQGFTVVENGIWVDEGAIEKRPGLIPAFSTAMPATANRLIPYDQQLLLTDGGHKLFAARNTGATIVEADLVSEATVRRLGIRREIDQSMTDVDMAVAGSYTVYAWRNTDDADVNYRIVETLSGTVVLTGVANVAVAAITANTVRVAGNGSHVLLTYADAAGNDLYARRIDCSTNPPTVGTETALLADLNGTAAYDICAMGSRWALVYRNTTPVRVVREVVNANPPTLGWNDTGGSDATFVGIGEVGSNVYVPFVVPGTNDVNYRVVVSSTGAAVITVLLEAGAAQPGPLGVVAITSTAAMFSWKSAASTMRWRTGDNAGVLGSMHVNYRVIAESKPLYVAASDAVYQWVRTGVETSDRGIFVLVHLDRTAGVATTNMRPVATAAFGTTPGGERTNLAHIATLADTERRVAVLVQAATGSALLGGDELRATWGDANRHMYQRFGRSVYVGGGVLQQWDGRQLVENSYIQTPFFTAVAGGAGGSLATGSYNVALVYEEFDDNGELSRSLVHTVSAIAVTNPQVITCTIRPLTITLRQDNAQPMPRVELALYITEANSSGPLFRTQPYGSAEPNPFNATANIATGNAIITAVNTANPTLYTTGGVLENDAVYGGATVLFEHKGRLHAAGGEDPEVFFISQPRVDGEPALFNLALGGRIAGHVITGGASMDDAAIYFTETGIFRVHGEGPNATGDLSSGSFSEPIPIPSETGCTRGAASVIATPFGVLFGGRAGIYLLDRAFNVQYFSGPVEDTFDAFSTIRRATLDPLGQNVRFLVEDGGLNARVLVYDMRHERWSVFSYFGGAGFYDAMQTGISAPFLLRRSNRIVYIEIPGVHVDAGELWYGVSIVTGDIGFGNPAKLQRVKRLGLMIDRFGTGGLTIEVARDGGPYTSPAYSWSQADIAALTTDTVRVNLREQKGRRWRVRIKETVSSSPDKGLGYVGLNFETASIGGTARSGGVEGRS